MLLSFLSGEVGSRWEPVAKLKSQEVSAFLSHIIPTKEIHCLCQVFLNGNEDWAAATQAGRYFVILYCSTDSDC